MKHYFLLLILLVFSCIAEAKEVSYDEALQTAREFFAPASSSKKQVKALKSNLSLAKTFNQTEAEKPAFYIINNGEKGFVIVSADDNAKTILGYSDKGAFDAENIPINVQFWLEHYANDITDIAKSDISKPLYATTNTYEPISPLLGNIEHDQGEPYNNMCPYVGDRKPFTGCAATAAAQIMTYWKYPAKGKGQVSYDLKGTTLSADLSQSTYDWSNILDTYVIEEFESETMRNYNETQANAVALLLRDIGYASEMSYSSGSSGTTLNAVAVAFINNFGYDKSLQKKFFNRNNWAREEEVLNELYAELKAGRPIFFSGQSGVMGGHAFVCDGIAADGKLHINWGWNGKYNGDFALTAFEPAGTDGAGAGTGKFTRNIMFLMNIQPDKGTSEIMKSWGVEKLLYSQNTNEFSKADNTDRILFETGDKYTPYYNFNYVQTTIYFGYGIYNGTTSISASYASWYYMLGDERRAGDGKSLKPDINGDEHVSIAPELTINDLVSGVNTGVYDLYFSALDSKDAKKADPIYVKSRGQVKNKIAVGKDKVYIYPASESNYNHTNNPTDLTATQNEDAYTLSWSGTASNYILCTWTDTDLTVEKLSAKTKSGVRSVKNWAVFAYETQGDIVYAISEIMYGEPLSNIIHVDEWLLNACSRSEP